MIVTGILLVLFPSLVFAWVSNPQGYLVGRYTQYSYCDGSTTSQVAQAIGQCVYSGLIGYPRINTYTMYSSPYESDGATFINAVSYYDKNCTKVAGTAVPTKLNACTTSGSSIYFTFSQTLPQFSGGYVEQTVFNYTGEATTNCSSDSMVMSVFNFGAGCLYDCGGGSSSCQFYSCASGSSTGSFLAILSRILSGGQLWIHCDLWVLLSVNDYLCSSVRWWWWALDGCHYRNYLCCDFCWYTNVCGSWDFLLFPLSWQVNHWTERKFGLINETFENQLWCDFSRPPSV